jgi:hypothetical protein
MCASPFSFEKSTEIVSVPPEFIHVIEARAITYSEAAMTEVSDYLSGLDRLLTNTLCYLSAVILSVFNFMVGPLWLFFRYEILGLPRPPPTPEEIAAELERQRRLEELNRPPPPFDPKLLRRRQYAIDELISSEHTYQRKLTTLRTVYEPAMKKFFTLDESATCFSTLPPLLSLSNEVVKACETEARRGIQKAEIGHLFTERLNIVQKFVPYITRYVDISSIVNRLMNQNQNFVNALDLIEQQYDPITSLIVEPVQRMPRYHLLLKEVLKATPDWHSDFQPLQQAMEKLQKDAKIADKALAEVSRRAKLLELEKTIRGCPKLLNNTRKYIGVWPVKGNDLELLVFSDLLIITGTKKEGLARRVVKEARKVQELSQALSVEKTDEGLMLKTTGEKFAVDVSERAQQLFDTVDALIAGRDL